MKEQTLKNWILFLMLTAKIFIIGLIIFHYATDGLEKNEMYSIVTLIIPLLTAYLTAIIKDVLANPYKKNKSDKEKIEVKRVKNSISIMTFIVFPVYFLALVIIINQTAKGLLQADDLQKYVGIIESVFGIYVGQIIFTLFKKEEK